jgi:hypothetical protein
VTVDEAECVPVNVAESVSESESVSVAVIEAVSATV